MKIINYGGQSIDHRDEKSVLNVLKNKLLTTGPKVKLFEQNIKKFVESRYAISCNSGTSAIHLALLSLNLKEKSIVIMPCVNFISAYNLCKTMNLRIFFADVDSFTGQITPDLIKKCIKKNNLKKIDLLFTMHLGGYPENIEKFFELKKKYKFKIIEDACHSFGSRYKIKNKIYKVGGCMHADISTFSFHPLKSITTGEGGAVTTNNSEYAKKILMIRSHEILKKKKHWDYDIKFLGFNYRLSDINCSLGISQLSKISKFLKKRESIYYFYKKKLSGISPYIKIPIYNKNLKPSYHLILLNIDFQKFKKTKNQFLEYMKKRNILLQYHYIPIYKFSICKKSGKNYINAEKYYKNTVSLPVHLNLTKKDLQKIINNIFNFFKIKKI